MKCSSTQPCSETLENFPNGSQPLRLWQCPRVCVPTAWRPLSNPWGKTWKSSSPRTPHPCTKKHFKKLKTTHSPPKKKLSLPFQRQKNFRKKKRNFSKMCVSPNLVGRSKSLPCYEGDFFDNPPQDHPAPVLWTACSSTASKVSSAELMAFTFRWRFTGERNAFRFGKDEWRNPINYPQVGSTPPQSWMHACQWQMKV